MLARRADAARETPTQFRSGFWTFVWYSPHALHTHTLQSAPPPSVNRQGRSASRPHLVRISKTGPLES